MNCPNCGKQGPHFVPPSLGELGFYICNKVENKDESEQTDKDSKPFNSP